MKPIPSLAACRRFVPVLLLALSLRTAHAQTQIIYDNSAVNSTNVYYSNLEYGDEILFSGPSRTMTEFQIEYFGDFAVSGSEMARLRIYKNDGPPDALGDATPGTVLYDSGNFSVTPGYQTKAFTGLHITVPNDLTWTIQFKGLAGGDGDQAGLVIQGPPNVGSGYDDFWLKTTSSGWQTFRWVSLNPGDVTDSAGLIARLTSDHPDPVSAYLWDHFQPGAKQQILNSATADAALVAALNGIITGSSIYDATRFAGVTLSADAQALLQAPYRDDSALNRMLLHDAYPDAIAPKLTADFTARLIGLALEQAKVSISRAESGVFLDWAGTSVLQSAASVKGPYHDIPEARNHFRIDPHSTSVQFWRLRD